LPLKKKFGQHHLIRSSICEPLVEYLAPADRLVVEIGPGGGVLTRGLLASGARVWALEIDLAWAVELGSRLPSSCLSTCVVDAAQFDWRRLPVGTLLTGNLPFNVATSIIERQLPHWERIPRAAYLVQKEVGDRLTAGPGEPAYGALSVLTRARARVCRLGRVSRGSFRPPPRVDGVFVGFELVAPPLDESRMEGFVGTVRLAFAQRRKQLANALSAGWGREVAAATLAAAAIDPRARAEALALEQFLALHTAYEQVADVGSRSGRDRSPPVG
jgi:16S rRNA (adenine1518-N6/adenine1519-N6)-dimethyltransferase